MRDKHSLLLRGVIVRETLAEVIKLVAAHHGRQEAARLEELYARGQNYYRVPEVVDVDPQWSPIAVDGKDLRYWVDNGFIRSPTPVESGPQAEPSQWANYLMDLLLNKADREAIPGDLEEDFYAHILPKYGPAGARFWYWWQALDAVVRRNTIARYLILLLDGLPGIGRGG